jgi:uncharacterized protein YjbI with pentapeptide repeats
MQKFISISCALLAFFTASSVFAESTDPAPTAASVAVSIPTAPTALTCVEWKSSIAVDTAALNKLQKNSASDKPASGLSYTKDQFVVLLGKNFAKAKEILANSKDKLSKTSEGKVDLKDVTLNGFNLSGLNFDNVDFKGSEMNGADLSGSSLRGASLAKVELEGANLNNANLAFATLTKTKFINASLCSASLATADLEDADMRGAYLKDARLDRTKNIPLNIFQNAQTILILGLPVPPPL